MGFTAVQQADDSRARDCSVPEATIIRRILDGETDLYQILADRYSRRIYCFIRKIVKNDTDAEDVVQEAHLRALTYLHLFRGGCQFVTWLSHVATNVAYRQLERRRRLEKLLDSTISSSGRPSPMFAASIPDPERCIRDREVREILQRALTKLPQHYQLVFLMKEVNNVGTPEIAKRLRIRQTNVRLQLHRARRMLRRTINHDLQ